MGLARLQDALSLWEKVGEYDKHMPSMAWEDWDFWVRVAAHSGAFFHLPKIGFDYRVRSDSMIVKTIGFDYRMQRDPSNVVRISPRLDEVVNYYFRQAGIGLLQATA